MKNLSAINDDKDIVTKKYVSDIGINANSPMPNFNNMNILATYEFNISDANYHPIYTIENSGLNYIDMDLIVAYRLTVTGTGINEVADIIDVWHNPISYPNTTVLNKTISTSSATSGIRYLRAVYPVVGYLNDTTYPLGQEIAAYNATERHIKIEVFKTSNDIAWKTTTQNSIYVSSTYNGNSSMTLYTTRGWIFRSPQSFTATSASSAGYITAYEPATIGNNAIKAGASAISANHLAYLADDGLVYDISNKTKNISVNYKKIGVISNAISANAAITATYFRAAANLSSTMVGTISHATFALGRRVFLRCTMDSNGNIHSDNYLATDMSAGYTWLPFGVATASNTVNMDTRGQHFYTLDANGKLTHIDGKQVAGSDGEANVIETVKVNGTALTPDANKAVNVTVPSAVTEATVSGWGFTKNTGTYSKPSEGIPKTDLTTDVQTSLEKADSAIQSSDISNFITKDVNNLTYYTKTTDINNALNLKQNITDDNLQTVNKTIPSAINEVNNIAKGANQALSYGNYSTMITAFNALAADVYNVGQNVMIVTLEVPDLWISTIESTSSQYTYTTDEAFINSLKINGYVQVGYYRLSALETQKVDLTEYAKTENIPTELADLSDDSTHRLVTDTEKTTWNNKQDTLVSGTNIKTLNNSSLLGSGNITALTNINAYVKNNLTYNQSNTTYALSAYQGYVLNRDKEAKSNKVTSISSSSTDTQYPSAKVVYDLTDDLQKQIDSLGDDLQTQIDDLSETIPAEVTESTVSGWGFTKNTGTYSKPSGGIPKTDLASDVQTSLGNADSALETLTGIRYIYTSNRNIYNSCMVNWYK